MTEQNNREQKGKEIANNPNQQIFRINDKHYRVKSQTTKGEYDVIFTNAGWACNCGDYRFRHICCKHVHSIEFSIKIRDEVRKKNRVVISPVSVSSCLYCKSNNISKDGLRHNKSVTLQKWHCDDCKRYFTINIGFEKMKHDPQAITSAMQLYFTGESLRNVQKFLKFRGADVSHVTIYKWIRKYTGLMTEYLDKITPQVGDTWRADEVFIKVRGNQKYLFAMMDDETRFLIAQEVADSKNHHDARNLFRMAKEIAEKKPTKLITDGLPAYREAYLKEYFTREAPRTVHESHITLKGDRNNNMMERLNGEIRDREKVVRGLKKNDSPLIDGYQIYHNYIRPHMSLDGKTPADKCSIEVQGENKWLTIIQNARQTKINRENNPTSS